MPPGIPRFSPPMTRYERARAIARAALILIVCHGFFSGAPAAPRVVVIGFDGADSRLVERYMGEGKLPNLARLKEDGAYSPLTPTNPPQTCVSWSAFATGTNPGK